MIVIWWTNQSDCEAIGESLPPEVPAHISEQYQSRYGRNGRGRLWVDDRYGEVSVDPWPESPLGNRLGKDYGGIVLSADERVSVSELPGVFTDDKLRRV